MRLAFSLFKFFPYGGLPRDFLRILGACQALGHEVHAFAMEWEAEPPADFELTVLAPRARSNHRRVAEYARRLAEEVGRGGFDAVVGFNRVPGLDVYFAADPCFAERVRRLKGPWYRLTPRYRRFAEFERAVFAPEAGTEILLIAEPEKANFIRHYDTPPERFHLLPPAIDPDRLAPPDRLERRAALRQEFGLAENERLLLMVGSGFRTKGLDRALRAMAALPAELRERSRLWVIGEDKRAAFEQLARRLGLAARVRFLGGRRDVQSFMLAADLLVHPAYSELAGIVLLEAMASALPVLTTEVCGYAPYVARAGGGVVLPSPFSQVRMNEALRELLVSPALPELGERGLAFVRREDMFSQAQRAAEVIDAVARRRGRFTRRPR